MLKRMLASTAALALFALPLRAQAAAAAGAGDQVTLTGQVIDVNCYSTHQLSGAQHKNCATACANKGVSLAILTNDGTIYMPVSSKPADPQNSRLLAFAEGKVKVTGTHRMANGLHTIEIATVEAAS
jgi:type 1 fimbria pilin